MLLLGLYEAKLYDQQPYLAGLLSEIVWSPCQDEGWNLAYLQSTPPDSKDRDFAAEDKLRR